MHAHSAIVDYDTFLGILNRPGGYDPAGTAGQAPSAPLGPPTPAFY